MFYEPSSIAYLFGICSFIYDLWGYDKPSAMKSFLDVKLCFFGDLYVPWLPLI